MMRRVVNFSGGIGSWAAAKRVAAKHGTDNLTLLFADVIIEDDDLYIFLVRAAANVTGVPPSHTHAVLEMLKGIPPVSKLVARKEHLGVARSMAMHAVPCLKWICEGRTPWEVFKDVRFIGNTRVDPCSKILKRDYLDKWRDANCTPAATVAYFGIDWTEEHRIERVRERIAPWKAEAPLCDPPYLEKPQILELLATEGIAPPRLYGLGFPHGNCGGTCIKAGQAQFRLLLEKLPKHYEEWERQELGLRDYLGKDVSVLRDRRGGGTRAMTLKEFRLRLEKDGADYDKTAWGGCGCAVG